MFEFLKSLLESSKDRLKSPILGTYALAFIVWNWRPIIVLCFSNFSIEDRITYIDLWFCNKWSILGPIGILAIVTVGVPYLMMLIDQILEKSKSVRKELKNKEKIAELDHLINAAVKEFEIQNKKSGTKTISELQSEINILEKEKNSIIESNRIEREKNLLDIQNLNSLNSNLNNTIKKIQNKNSSIDEFINELKRENLMNDYLNLYSNTSQSISSLPTGQLFDFLTKNGLINIDSSQFKFNELGSAIFTVHFESSHLLNGENSLSILLKNLTEPEIRTIKTATVSPNQKYSISGHDLRRETLDKLSEMRYITIEQNYSTFYLNNSAKNLKKYLELVFK